MAKTVAKNDGMAEALAALRRVDEINAEIADLILERDELKNAATKYAVVKGVSVFQLDGRYWRRMQRYTSKWIGRRNEVPVDVKLPSSFKPLFEICQGRVANGKPLWNLVTKRVPDPEKINEAVGKGWITQQEVEKAFIEIPQKPYLQRFNGVANGD